MACRAQLAPSAATVQRRSGSAAPRRVQRLSVASERDDDREVQRKARPGAQLDVDAHVIDLQGGAPLDPQARARLEPQLGWDFGRVRVHAGPAADASARSLDAMAYTLGEHIVFRQGQYAPGTPPGDRLLAHELTHVVQQRAAAPMAAGGADGGARVQRQPADGPVPAQPVAPTPAPVAAAPAPCVPATALTWASFAGTPPAGSTYAADTRFNHALQGSGADQRVVATFDGSASWVKPKWGTPTVRTANGCAAPVSACEAYFKSLGPDETGTYALGQGTGCAASPQPDTTIKATNKGECETKLGVECDRVAGLESKRLLAHEQLHFDIACVMAKKGNAALTAKNASSILSAVISKSSAQTTLYDSETQHGCNATKQAAWATEVGNGLPKVTIP